MIGAFLRVLARVIFRRRPENPLEESFQAVVGLVGMIIMATLVLLAIVAAAGVYWWARYA